MKNSNENLDEIIFENRNKDYGAYVLRKNYNKNMISAVVIAIVIFLLGVSVPLIANYFNRETVIHDNKDIVFEINKLKENKTVEKLPELPVEKKKEITYRPPVVSTNEDEFTDDLSNLMEEVKNTNLHDTNTSAGIPDEKNTTNIMDEEEALKIHTIVEEMPEFPGGDASRIKFLTENIHYPVLAREMGIQGPVYMTFVIEKDGYVSSVQILRGIGGGCDEEASRVISQMPKWKPGRQNGKEVRVQFNMPIMFTLK